MKKKKQQFNLSTLICMAVIFGGGLIWNKCQGKTEQIVTNTATSHTEQRIDTEETLQDTEEESNDESATPEGHSEKGVNGGDESILLPVAKKGDQGQILRRTAYITSYNKEYRLPNWTAWYLPADHTSGSNKRDGIDFQEDTDVAEPRATRSDYYRSGYDRGHMCPAADNKWSATAMSESFLYTNMCPQAGSLNKGAWNDIEDMCRSWAKKYRAVYIVSGPIFYSKSHKTLGRNKVAVPDAFFKLVLCRKGTPKAIAFIYDNDDVKGSIEEHVTSVDNVENITGYDFFSGLPDDIENKVEKKSNLSEW